MFSRVWFDWARPDDDIWGVGGSPSRSSAGRSRRSRICTAAAATPAAILDTEVELRETLVRTSSSADRSGTRAHTKKAPTSPSPSHSSALWVYVITAVLIYKCVMVGGLFAAWRTTWIPTHLLHFTFRAQNQFGRAAGVTRSGLPSCPGCASGRLNVPRGQETRHFLSQEDQSPYLHSQF